MFGTIAMEILLLKVSHGAQIRISQIIGVVLQTLHEELFWKFRNQSSMYTRNFSAKISSSGTVILVTNTQGGYFTTSGGSISGENVLGTGQFAFYTKSNQKIEQGDAQTGPNSCSSISEPVYHITWMNESLCTRDGYSRFGGTGTIESVRLTSGNSSEPQIIASFLGTGTITLGAKDIVLTAADTPVIGQINTSNGSASSTGFGWGWSIALPNYVGYAIQDIEVTSLGDIHVVLSSSRDTVLRIIMILMEMVLENIQINSPTMQANGMISITTGSVMSQQAIIQLVV